MLTNMSELFLRTLRDDPAEAELDSHKLLIRAGYIRRVAPGIYTWLPLGLRVLRKIEAVIREEMALAGAQEVHFPALLPAEPYVATGRWDEYGPNLFRLEDRRGNDYLLAPTHEEMFTLLVKSMFTSYKDLPVTLYQIQTKYRDEARARGGLLRGREFIMKDAYSFDLGDEQLDVSYLAQRRAYEAIFERIGLEFVICAAMAGAMGGSKSEEFLHPSAAGEDTYVVSPGGYVANVEAVTTPVPEAQPTEGLPAATTLATPDCETIEDLVAYANANYPRDGAPWTAADTLKNVVFTLINPEGDRELLVVGLPGDREIDPKRLEAAVAPAEVEVATEADLAAHPELVVGYIGPAAIGPNAPGRSVDDEGNPTGSVRYLVDPRVSLGSVWISGANSTGQHDFGLVCGRDFTFDGTIEAAEVLEGDPAPDGSGPLALHRGIEVGHIFQLGQKYAEALGLSVLDQNGRTQTVTMGSYGIGVSRVLAALAESSHDEHGLAWGAAVAPYDVQVVLAGKGEEIDQVGNRLASELNNSGLDVLLDERKGVSAGVKFADAELLGNPIILVVGRGLKNGVVEVRERRSGVRTEIPVGEAVQFTLNLNQELLEQRK